MQLQKRCLEGINPAAQFGVGSRPVLLIARSYNEPDHHENQQQKDHHECLEYPVTYLRAHYFMLADGGHGNSHHAISNIRRW
jgi:hypothetical protein